MLSHIEEDESTISNNKNIINHIKDDLKIDL